MAGNTTLGCEQTPPRAALGQLDGPLIVAGLDVAPVDVPAKPDMRTTHADGLPHVAAIRQLHQAQPSARTRGSEVAIQGFLDAQSDYDGVLLVLADETCWAHISAQEVVSFQTFLTPALSRALRASIPDLNADFDTAVDATLSRPERLAQQLSSAKAGETNLALAHLLGAEIAAAKPYWLGQQIVILGDGDAGAPYQRILERHGTLVTQSDLTQAYLGGFTEAWRHLTDQSS